MLPTPQQLRLVAYLPMNTPGANTRGGYCHVLLPWCVNINEGRPLSGLYVPSNQLHVVDPYYRDTAVKNSCPDSNPAQTERGSTRKKCISSSLLLELLRTTMSIRGSDRTWTRLETAVIL